MKFISEFEGPWSTPKRTARREDRRVAVAAAGYQGGKMSPVRLVLHLLSFRLQEGNGALLFGRPRLLQGLRICARVCPAKAIMLVREEI